MKQTKKSKLFQVGLISFLIVGGINLYAADAADQTFGTNGKVLEVLSEDHGRAKHKAVLVQNDDKIIAIGSARDENGYDVISLYRYLPNGTRDSTFGTDGASFYDYVCLTEGCPHTFPYGKENVVDAIFQSDGKIIVAEAAWHGVYEGTSVFGLFRFNNDGTPDDTWGDRGFSTGGGVYPSKIAIQDDDKVLVVGRNFNYDKGVALTRFTTRGYVDLTFGELGGTVLINHKADGAYYNDEGNDVVVQPDGKIIVVGSSTVKGCGADDSGIYTRGLMLRFNEDGTLDHMFSADGILKFNVASIFDVKPWNLSETHPCQDSVFKSVSVQPDGKIVVMGAGYNAAFATFLARFNPDGSLDTTFGYQGAIAVYENYDYTVFDHLNTRFTHVWGRKYDINNMLLKKNGNIVMSGHITYDDNYYHYGFLALHFTNNGAFDKRYGGIGDARVDVSFPDDFLYGGATAYDLAEQSSGKLILAGYADGYDAPSTAVLARTILRPTQTDFIGNSSNDLLWHKASTGAVRIMEMNGMIPESNISVVESANTNLLPKGIGDFTGEGKPDILFHNQNSGNLRIWEMDGTAKVNNIQVLGSSNTNLQIAGVGDFDQDGDTDIATFNTNSGALRMWVMDGTTRVDNVLVLTGANLNLVPRGAGDMNNDGIPDIVLRNNKSGTVRVWTMNDDLTRKGNESVANSSNTNLELRGVVDINSDGNNDILNYNTNTGKLRAWLMDGNLSYTENVEIVQDLDFDWSVRN